MGYFVKHINGTIWFCLNVAKVFGLMNPDEPTKRHGLVFFSWFMFLAGAPVITQAIAMFQLWGNITEMTSASFLLFTNISLANKMLHVFMWRHSIQEITDKAHEELSTEDREEGIQIVKSCNLETTRYQIVYMMMAFITCLCWSAGAEEGELPLTAWYPWDTSTSPAYEVTYFIQSSSLIISALINVSLDNFIAAMIASCTCRLRLVALSIRTACDSLDPPENLMYSEKDQKLVQKRIEDCVVRHEAVLKTVDKIQICFDKPILLNFTVSMVIICVTAFQLSLVMSNKNWVLIISMIAYLGCMTLEVFLFCYHGNELTEMSSEMSSAAYFCPWYMLSVPLRRTLQIIMVRSYNITILTAGGFTTLSLACFTSIIKASYTFFTVLDRVDN